MKRKELYGEILRDLANGDMTPAVGFLDWWMLDLKQDLIRLVPILNRQYQVPEEMTVATLNYLIDERA
jgi:hypothetical protein